LNNAIDALQDTNTETVEKDNEKDEVKEPIQP
jgi:hypothetical protein